ncbi:MAG: grpE [Glaciihabitans sp.]|nr:grpE [Glaciihabitans sp.]MCU1534903.1 grpE [Glaciihabitans sp.]
MAEDTEPEEASGKASGGPKSHRTPKPKAQPEPQSEDGDTADVDGIESLFPTEGPDVETLTQEEIDFLDQGERDLVAEMRNDLARAQAELVNFRNRVERDRAANRDSVIAEVIRSLLPALDDLTRAEAHGDLEGSPLEIVAKKLHATFERYGLRVVGEKGEAFDPHFHEAIVQLPSADVTVNTVADVIEPGYALGDRLLRAAKVAVSVPE